MRFQTQVILTAVLAGLCILGDVAAGDEAGSAAAAAQRRPMRMLFVTQSAGFKHGSVTREAQQLSPAERTAYHGDHPVIDELVQSQIDLVQSVEALVFVYPTWWSGLPAVLKGWLERVMVPGVGFRFEG